MADVPVFITYRDRRTMLDRCLRSLITRGFDDITVIDNDSAEPFVWGRVAGEDTFDITVVRSDNSHRQLAPWLLDLVPDDRYYIVTDCDLELDCPPDVAEHMIGILERWPEIPKVGLGIRTDDLLFPPPQHYAWSYLMEYSVEDRFRTIEEIDVTLGPDYYDVGTTRLIDAPTDTTFAMYRPGTGWPGIVGARTTAPYLCRHLPWYNAEYSDEERAYYARTGKAWTMGHSAETLLPMSVAVPFTELRAETVAALTGTEVRYAPMLLDESYWELLRDLWEMGDTFTIIEHDIVVNETTLDELRLCESDWCAMPFPYRGNPRSFALACSKFSAELIARHPDLIEYVGRAHDAKHPPKHWCRLDAWLWESLTERGEKRCEHIYSEPVGHVGPQIPKHGCLS